MRPTGQFFTVNNNATGIADAVKRLQALKPKRVLIESTGRLELEFVYSAHKAGLPVVICNPGQVRHFAKAAGRIAKTDKLDAHDIAHFGEVMQPKLSSIKPEKLRAVLFVSMMSAIQCHPKLKPMYQRIIAAGKPKKKQHLFQ